MNVYKSFGPHHILTGISLAVNPGTVYGLVGLNGAGKTTFLSLLMGLLKPDQGVIKLQGKTHGLIVNDIIQTLGSSLRMTVSGEIYNKRKSENICICQKTRLERCSSLYRPVLG